MFPLIQSLWRDSWALIVGSVVTAEIADSGPITVVPSGSRSKYNWPVLAPAGAMYSPERIFEGLWYVSTRRTTAQLRTPLIGVMMNLDSSVFCRKTFLCHSDGFVWK